jgi:hypothetical protein
MHREKETPVLSGGGLNTDSGENTSAFLHYTKGINAPEVAAAPRFWFYHQKSDKKDQWRALPVESKASFIAQQQPRYTTILDTSNKEPGEDISRQERECARYRGPFYIDWDARDDIEFAITKANQFLTKLQECGRRSRQHPLLLQRRPRFSCGDSSRAVHAGDARRAVHAGDARRINAPVFNQDLAILFQEARKKVESEGNGRRSSRSGVSRPRTKPSSARQPDRRC